MYFRFTPISNTKKMSRPPHIDPATKLCRGAASPGYIEVWASILIGKWLEGGKAGSLRTTPGIQAPLKQSKHSVSQSAWSTGPLKRCWNWLNRSIKPIRLAHTSKRHFQSLLAHSISYWIKVILCHSTLGKLAETHFVVFSETWNSSVGT